MRSDVLTVLWLVFVSGTAIADQRDPRLDDLFDRLATAPDRIDALRLGAVIRDIWRIYPGDSYDVVEFLNRGGRAASRGEDHLAELSFAGVIDQAPEFVEGWHQRGRMRLRRGDIDGAIADLDFALGLEPRHFDALSALGRCYQALDRPEAALAAFEAALELHPHLPAALAGVGELQGPASDRI